ncbi:MAG: T9SS type A sorting domain-containing protein [Aureispira sp.]
MFFEDAVGNTDTLILGYDANGTVLIDSSFGEANIIGLPLDSIFDVRISDAFFNSGVATFHTKKQILPNSCASWLFPLVEIDIKSKHWPVTATWDSSLFNASCRAGSIFTSFNPGGWWDVVGFPSDLYRAEFAAINQVTFTSNYTPSGYDDNYAYVNAANDTLPIFWMSFGDSSLISLGIENLTTDIQAYPNPVKDLLYIDMESHLVQEVRIIDRMGRQQAIGFKNGYIDLSNLNAGYYLIMLVGTEGKTQLLKIIKG